MANATSRAWKLTRHGDNKPRIKYLGSRGGNLSSRPARSRYWVTGQLEHTVRPYLKNKQNKSQPTNNKKSPWANVSRMLWSSGSEASQYQLPPKQNQNRGADSKNMREKPLRVSAYIHACVHECAHACVWCQIYKCTYINIFIVWNQTCVFKSDLHYLYSENFLIFFNFKNQEPIFILRCFQNKTSLSLKSQLLEDTLGGSSSIPLRQLVGTKRQAINPAVQPYFLF